MKKPSDTLPASLRDDFANPGAEFRGAPFWAWNGKLAPEEVRRQIRIMHDMKMGGFFMHSRAGLATEYLGKEWFDCVRAAVDEARSLGMKAASWVMAVVRYSLSGYRSFTRST